VFWIIIIHLLYKITRSRKD